MANAHPITAKAAAAEIVTLINSRAQSPRPHEIEAIIAKVAPTYGSSVETRTTPLPEVLELLSLRRKYLERLSVHGGMTPGSFGYQQAEAECDAAGEALYALADRIWETLPRQTWGGVVARALLADHYSDYGTAAVGDEACGTTERRAIHELILSVRATEDSRLNVSGLPGKERPEQGARLLQLRKMITEIEAAKDAAGPPAQWTHDDCDRIDALNAPLFALADAVWATPVRSLSDLQARALIARHWHREKLCSDGKDRIWQDPSEVGDWGEQTIAELIHGVLQFMREQGTAPAA